MSERSQFGLLTERRFLPLFLTQFFGAANDNVFKFAFTVLATYSAAEWGGLDPKSAGAVIGGVFILPFVLFSATAGQLADKYDKAALIRFIKNLEIAIMLVIAAGFVWQVVALLFAGVFLMGLHSTLFGPVKYAYLPQHLRRYRTGRRQRPGGDGHLRRHSAGHHPGRRAGRRARCRAATGWRAASIALGADRARCRGVRAGVARAGPGPEDQLESVLRDLAQRRPSRAATARCSCRCSASPGCGSSVRSSSPPSPASPRTRWAATRAW